MKRVVILLCCISALLASALWASPAVAEDEATPLRLAILEYRPHTATLQQWQPTIDQLERAHPGPVTVMVLSYDRLNDAVSRREVDLVLTNSSHTVQLQRRNALTRLASVSHIIEGHTVGVFGGVIVTHPDSDIHELADLQDARIAAPTPGSLGGYQAQRFILQQNGVTVDENQFVFSGLPHDRALELLQQRAVDVAFVRTGFLETWWQENPGKQPSFRIINPQLLAQFPLAVSTRLYPEWSMAALDHVPASTKTALSQALLALEPVEGTQARWPQSWSLPKSDLAIFELLQTLNLPPFEQPEPPPETPLAFWGALLVLLLLLIAATVFGLQRRRGPKPQPEQPATPALFSDPRVVLQNLPDPVIVLNAKPPYQIEFASPNIESLLGFTAQQLEAIPNWLQVNTHLNDRDRLFERLRMCRIDEPLTAYHPPERIWLRHADGNWRVVWLSSRCDNSLTDEPKLTVTLRSADPEQDIREQLHTAISKSDIILMQIAVTGRQKPRLLAANPRLAELTGHGLAQLQADFDTLLQRIHPDDRVHLQHLTDPDATEPFTRSHDLTLRLYDQQRSLHWIKLLAAGEKTDQESTLWHISAADQTQAVQREQMLAAIGKLQRSMMKNPTLRQHFKALLDTILQLTDCEHGFIGEVFDLEQGKPWMKTWALTNMAWDMESQQMFLKAEREGFVIERLDNLIGEPLKTGKTFITHKPNQHPAFKKLPHGHPVIENFASIPIYREQKIVGLIGLANSQAHFQQDDLAFLDEHTPALGQLIHHIHILAKTNQAKQRLEQELDSKRQLMHSLGEGVYGTDHSGKIIFVNRTAQKILGFQEEELVGQDGHELFHHKHPDGRPYPHEDCPVFQTMQDGLTRKRGDEYVVTRDGRFVPVAMTSSVISDAKGSNLGAVVVFRDISSFKAAQDHIRVLTTALDSAQAAIVLTDTNGQILWGNRALEQLTGYPLAEISGKNPGQLFHSGKQDEHFYRHLWDTIKRGEVWEGELINKRRDGRYYHEHLTIAPVLTPKGEVDKFVGIKRDITQEKQNQERMRYLAITDPLTKLANRRYFIERAEKEFARFKRKDTPGCLLMLDIDHFKKVNDTYGHGVGDDVLVAFTQVLQQALRETDLAGRLGGEEFAILLPQESLPGAETLAERVRRRVEALVIDAEQQQIKITVSIGVAQFQSEDNNIEQVIAHADKALYTAKRQGRNRVIRYHEQLSED